LVNQLAAINSADEAAVWALRNLPAKNTLTAEDARIVEERFASRLSTMGDGLRPGGTPDGLAPDGPSHAAPDQSVGSPRKPEADTSQKASTAVKKQPPGAAVRPLGKTVRLRDKEHRKFVLR
jgi:hypothetical protein